MFHHHVAAASDHALAVALIGASATVIVAVAGGLAAYLANKRQQRRLLYSEAIKAAVGWKEMLYRVRRREKGLERELINKFHDLQDQISYYQAWIGSESEHMQRSYDRLVSGVKARTEDLITAAWNEKIRPVPGNARPDDEHPNLSDLTDSFLVDVRDHLSPWWWRRRRVRKRNSEER